MTVLEQMAAEAQVHYENTSLDMGRLGMRMVPPNSSAIGAMASIRFLVAGQLTSLESADPLTGTFTGITYPVGTVLFGPFRELVTDATARVIAHIENRRVTFSSLDLEFGGSMLTEGSFKIRTQA